MKITEKHLRSIIKNIIKESQHTDEISIDDVPDDQYFAWQIKDYERVDHKYHDVLTKHFQDQGNF